MAKIEQIYCTHCTYGSSAMERREGALAERVLGYSARASSLGDAELRKAFRHVEPFLYYYLPVDTPPEEKMRLDASQAPRRLVFYPTLNGLQMLAQISYRQQDTAGRPGSYFGHFLIGDRAAGAWNVLDCLRLWGAGWVEQDAADLPFALPSLAELADLRQGARPAIDDALLLAFLSTPPGQELEDPHGVIPPRWQAASLEERAALLRDALQAHLAHGSARRESVLLVVEPSLAALIFYGVARLLPRGPLRDEVSFSTFEPRPERLPVALAATTFHRPETTDLKPECYRGRGYVHNTFLKKCSDFALGDGGYARMMVAALLAGGWREVDRLLQGFESARASNARDLEELTQTLKLVPLLLDPAAELPHVQWSPVAVDYLGRVVRQRLAREPANSAVLAALVGTPRHVKVLKLIATEGESEPLDEAIEYLLHRLPEDGFAEVLASERIAEKYKVTALVEFVRRQARFPAPCEPLWSPSPRREALLAAVLSKLPGGTLDALSESVPPPQQGPYLLALLTVCRTNPAKNAARGQVARVMGAWRDQELCQFLSEHAAACSPQEWPEAITTLRERLPGLLHDLPSTGRQFDGRLELLWTWRRQFPEVAEAEERLDAWRNVRALLSSLRERPASKAGGAFGKSAAEPNAVGHKLAEALARAMPRKDYHDTAGDQRATSLRRLATVLLGRPDVLPDEVWTKMQGYLEHGGWTALHGGTAGGRQRARGKETKSITSLLVPILATFCFGMALAIVFLLVTHKDEAVDPTVAEVTSSAAPPPSAAKKNQSAKQATANDKGEKTKVAAAKSDAAPLDTAPDNSGITSPKSEKPQDDSGKQPQQKQEDKTETTPAAPFQPAAAPEGDPPKEPAAGKPQDATTPDDGHANNLPSNKEAMLVPESEKTATVASNSSMPVDDKKLPTKPPEASPAIPAEAEKPEAPTESASSPYVMPSRYIKLPDLTGKAGALTEIHKCQSTIGSSPFTLHGVSGKLSAGLGMDPKFANVLIVKYEKSPVCHVSHQDQAVYFKWLGGGEKSQNAAPLLRKCVLEINTVDTPHEFIALTEALVLPAKSFENGTITCSLLEFGRGPSKHRSLAYYLGTGEVNLGGKICRFGQDLTEQQPLQLIDSTSNAPLDRFLTTTMDEGNQNVSIKVVDSAEPRANVVVDANGTLTSGTLYRLLDLAGPAKEKAQQQIRVEDLKIGM